MADEIEKGPTLEQALQQAADRKRELDIKEREVAAKEREVLAKEEELKRSRWLNPTVIGLFAASLGLIGSVIVARVNNSNTQEVQRLQAEANVTLEAIKTGTGNTDAACKNLLFFVSLGLIRDSGQKIEGQCKGAPSGPPSLPSNEATGRHPVGQFTGKVIDGLTKKPLGGVRVSDEGGTFVISTDSGEFSLPVTSTVPGGDHIRLTFSKKGYAQTEVYATVNSPLGLQLQREEP